MFFTFYTRILKLAEQNCGFLDSKYGLWGFEFPNPDFRYRNTEPGFVGFLKNLDFCHITDLVRYDWTITVKNRKVKVKMFSLAKTTRILNRIIC